jgi:hypothetical protein
MASVGAGRRELVRRDKKKKKKKKKNKRGRSG